MHKTLGLKPHAVTLSFRLENVNASADITTLPYLYFTGKEELCI